MRADEFSLRDICRLCLTAIPWRVSEWFDHCDWDALPPKTIEIRGTKIVIPETGIGDGKVIDGVLIVYPSYLFFSVFAEENWASEDGLYFFRLINDVPYQLSVEEARQWVSDELFILQLRGDI